MQNPKLSMHSYVNKLRCHIGNKSMKAINHTELRTLSVQRKWYVELAPTSYTYIYQCASFTTA